MLEQLSIDGVRNLRQVTLTLGGQSALFAGLNGSGKTSLLEAVHLLSVGRSFRAASARSLIHFEADRCLVSGRVSQGGRRSVLGIERGRDGGVTARINREPVQSLAELNEALPVVIIDTNSAQLVAGAPEERRRFLDGAVFHVEHDFLLFWRRYQRALRQRNAGLRHGRLDADGAWCEELATCGEALTERRQRVTTLLQSAFREAAAALSDSLSAVSLRLRPGWDSDATLGEALFRQRDSDRDAGFTRVGPHRADLRLLTDGRPAGEVLSRGQQKLAVIALKLAQGQLIAHGRGYQPLYLIDDLAAELDSHHAGRVCTRLAQTGAQTLLTAVGTDAILNLWPGSGLSLFHVEQGAVASAPRDGPLAPTTTEEHHERQ